MKKLALVTVAIATLAGSSAMAQGVSVGVGPYGPGVSIDTGYRDHYRRDRDWRDSRNEYRVERRYHRDRDWDRRGPDRVYIEHERY